MTPIERFQNVRSVFLRLDGDADRAPVAMDSTDKALGVNPAQDSPYVTPIYGTRWAAGFIYHGTDRELSLYVAPLADAVAGKAQWRRLLSQADAVTSVDFAGERRARGEHAFHVIKLLWGFTKVRYRGLYKNTVRALMMFALSNLYLARRWLLPRQDRCAQ